MSEHQKLNIKMSSQQPSATQENTDTEILLKDIIPNQPENIAPKTGLSAQKTEEMRSKISGLGKIKISTPAKEHAAPETLSTTDVKTENAPAPAEPRARESAEPSSNKTILSFFWITTLSWIAYCAVSMNMQTILTSPSSFAASLATIFGVPALLWHIMSSAFLTQNGRLNISESSLQDELKSLLLPGKDKTSTLAAETKDLCEQAHEASKQAQIMLKSLQRARQGLREEVRDFSGVSKKIELHINRLSDTLSSKREELSETSNVLSNDYDTLLTKADQIKEKLETGAQSIAQAADDAADRTADIDAQFAESLGMMQSRADRINDRYEEIQNEFADKNNQLSSIMDDITDQASTIGHKLETEILNFEDSAQNVLKDVAHSAQTIRAQKEDMQAGVAELTQQTEAIQDAVKRNIDHIKEGANYVARQAKSIEDRVEDRAINLKEALQDITSQTDLIEEVGNEAANKLTESLSVAVSGAESINFAIRRAIESMEESQAKAQMRADLMTQKTAAEVEKINEKGQEIAARLQDSTNNIDQKLERLSGTLDLSETRLSNISETIDTHHEALQETTRISTNALSSFDEHIQRPLDGLKSLLTEIEIRQSHFETSLKRRVDDLKDTNSTIETSIETIRSSMSSHIQDLNNLSGQLSGQGDILAEKWEVQIDNLQSSIDEAHTKITALSDGLRDQKDIVQSFTSDAHLSELSTLRDDIADHFKALDQLSTHTGHSLSQLDAQLETHITSLSRHSDKTKLELTELTLSMEDTAKAMPEIYETALDKAESMKISYQELKEDCDGITQSNLAQLQKLGIMIDDQTRSSQQSVTKIEQSAKTAAQAMKTHETLLSQAATDASIKVEQASNALNQQSQAIHLLSDQALVKMDVTAKEIQSIAQETARSVTSATEKVSTATKDLSLQTEKALEDTSDVIQALKTTGIKTREEIFMLQETAEDISNNANQFLTSLKDQSTTLARQSAEQLSAIKQAGDAIQIRASEVSHHMKASLQSAKLYGQELKEQAADITNASAQTTDAIGKSVTVLSGLLDNIGSSAHDTTGKISQSRQKLSDEADRLMHVSSAALEVTKEASSTFVEQAQSLFKASQDVSAFTEALQSQENTSQRQAFLSASKFLVESLHSLSVDISRLKDGDISEREWNNFQKGDIAIFTRRLAELGTQWPMEKAQDKYRNDTEFRTYLVRYIRQFEELYEQAVTADHGALLSNMIASSDTAKLYTILCKIAGKPNAIQQSVNKKVAA